MITKIVYVYSLCNILINFIEVVSRSVYLRIVKFVLKDTSLYAVEHEYVNLIHLTALSDHYSRNAYYCVAGCTVFVAIVLSADMNERNSKKRFIYDGTKY